MNPMSVSVLAVTLLLSSITTAVAQTTSPTFQANGALAIAEGCGTTNSCTVVASRGSVQGTAATFLYYNYTIYDSTGSYQNYSGVGTIPNSAFQVQGAIDSLSVDTSKVQGFTNTLCNGDFTTGTFTCNYSASGGPVTVSWIGDPHIKLTYDGIFTSTAPGSKYISTGPSYTENATATIQNIPGASGSANANGEIGTNHNVSINVQFK